MKTTKEKQIKVLKTNVKLWNRYIRFCLSINVEFSANLRSADLSSANLRFADLRFADLRSADLTSADLTSANLRYADLTSANLRSADLTSANLRSADLSSSDLTSANLRYADLTSANLRSADLTSADLDMSCLPIWCGSLKAKFDLKLRIQVGFHFASLIANCEDVTEEEKEIYNKMLEYVNKFHRTDVKRLEQLK